MICLGLKGEIGSSIKYLRLYNSTSLVVKSNSFTALKGFCVGNQQSRGWELFSKSYKIIAMPRFVVPTLLSSAIWYSEFRVFSFSDLPFRYNYCFEA